MDSVNETPELGPLSLEDVLALETNGVSLSATDGSGFTLKDSAANLLHMTASQIDGLAALHVTTIDAYGPYTGSLSASQTNALVHDHIVLAYATTLHDPFNIVPGL